MMQRQEVLEVAQRQNNKIIKESTLHNLNQH